MTGFIEKDGTLHVDSVPLNEIAENVGTPCYIYSASTIESQFLKLKGAMEKALPKDRQPLLCFASKANSNVAILSLLRSLGSGCETGSEGELLRALKAGFKGNQIVTTGVGKTEHEIALSLNAGVLQFNVESIPEVHTINKVASELGKTAEIAFRLNPDVAGGGHSKISTGRKTDKFGILTEQIYDAFSQASSLSNIKPVGMSMHVGSQVFEVERFKEAFSRIPDVVKTLRAQGHKVTRLDIGGGFPIQYNNEKLLDLDLYAQWVNDIIVPLDTEIIMEPGRYLVGNAGIILSEVLYVKETPEKNFLIIDAGMNDLIRPAMYDAYHGIEPVTETNRARKLYDVVGPCCESGDTFTKDREIAEMKQGDLCAIREAGAYGASFSLNYNSRPNAAEVMVKDGQYSIIRPRQTYEDILGRDIIPDWIAS
jgi:diaminopimelate decarboxylase